MENLNSTISVRKRGGFRRLLAFAGPAYLVSVGYMDPGNWATDIQGGARFGYTLIWVLLMSNIMAILLQTLSARLGIVTGYDLAQGCRREYPKAINYILWILAEIAIAATDLAEALGTIIGLNLLLGLPLLWGCLVTAFDTFILLALQRLGVRKMEAVIVSLIAIIGASFVIEIFLAQPDWGGIARGFVPHLEPGALYIAIGIIGATVMPHNLYLHSSLVQSRAVSNTYTGRAEACKYNLIDSTVALNAAFFVNVAILIMAAADFHSRGMVVTEIQQAHRLLEPILGTHLAPTVFALALLAAGQSSTLTGTLSGQVVMEGFLNIRMQPWLRRLITRGIALLPAVTVIAVAGNQGTYQLLIFSQVILSLQLPFAVIPLIHFTSDKKKMGLFASKVWLKIGAWIIAGIIVVLNLKLVYDEVASWMAGVHPALWILCVAGVISMLVFLGYVVFGPLLHGHRVWESGVITKSRQVAGRIQPLRIQHIGVALEHSDADAEILSAAISMTNYQNAKLTLIHVIETPGGMLFGEEADSLHSREDYMYLEELAREIEAKDHPVEVLLRTGNPIGEIVRSVEELGLDMIVFGSHGHHGLEDLVFGETVTSVRHAINIPVLIVRVTTTGLEKPQRG